MKNNPLDYLRDIVKFNYSESDPFLKLTENNLKGITKESKDKLHHRIALILEELDQLKMPTKKISVESADMVPYQLYGGKTPNPDQTYRKSNTSYLVFNDKIESRKAMSIYISTFMQWLKIEHDNAYVQYGGCIYLEFSPILPLRINTQDSDSDK